MAQRQGRDKGKGAAARRLAGTARAVKKKLALSAALQESRGQVLQAEDILVEKIDVRDPASSLLGRLAAAGSYVILRQDSIILADRDPTDPVRGFDQDPNDPIIVADVRDYTDP